MSGTALEKLPHSCGSRTGLQVFVDEETGKVDGYCYACSTYVRHPYGEEKTSDEVEIPPKKTEEEVRQEVGEISSLGVVDLPTRRLRSKHLDHFGIKVGLSEEDGKTPVKMFTPVKKDGQITGYLVKTLTTPNYKWSVGETKGCDPVGWDVARKSGAYKLIITEGVEDAVAVRAIMERHGKKEFMPAVISLSHGTNSVEKNLSNLAAEIVRTFKEVVLCFDNDEPGQNAVRAALNIIPTALSVTLPEVDANECIMQGCQKAAHDALAFKAAAPKNSRLISAGASLHEEARSPTPYGELTWPFPTFNKLLRNIRLGTTIYIGAGVKMGKSELLNELAAHFIKEDGVKVFVAKPEEDNKKTYKLICNKMVNRVFHDPDVDFDYEAYDKAGEMLSGNLYMVDLYQHMDYSSLRGDIVAAAAEGCKAVFIDPITNLTNGMNAADANTKLQEISQDLAALALDLNLAIFLFCHLKAPDGSISKEQRRKSYDKGEVHRLGNCSHETGGSVQSHQFAGSRGMMRSCHLMIGLEGNKDPDLDADSRNLRGLTILEDRDFGNSAHITLHWNSNTTRFTEV